MKKLLLTLLLGLPALLSAQCPGLTPNVSTVDLTCFGMTDGSISATPSGGSGTYNYQLLDGSNNLVSANGTGIFNNLVAGSYNYVIEDQGNACYDTTAVILMEPSLITMFNNIVDDGCGNCNGQIDIIVTGGTPGYTYSIDGGSTFQGGSTFNNLCTGTYSTLVMDMNACIMQEPATVGQAAPITLNETNTPDSGSGDGSITLSATGGVGGFGFSWTGPNSFTSTSQNLTNLVAGTYVVTVIDGNGCTEVLTVVVQSTALVTTFWTMDPMCFASADGGINVSIGGGSGNFELEVTDLSYNVFYSSTTNFQHFGLWAGQYYYIVTDLTTSDADTVMFELYDPMPITAFESITHATCGLCNGEIFINVTGGVAPYTFNWSNGTTTQVVTGLCAGTYNVDIVDGNGCIQSLGYTVTNTGTAFSGSTTPTNATCGNCDGSIAFTPSGGTGPFTYQWDDPSGQTTNPATNLCDGIYTLSVTDGSGCSMSFMDTISDGSTVFASAANPTNSSCFACDGSVMIIGGGGVPPYTYVNVLTQDTNSTGMFDSLCANIHYAEVIDANGCSNIVTYTIGQTTLGSFTYSSNVTHESAAGASDGSIDIVYDTIANPNLTFEWSPISVTTADLQNLPAGVYTLTIEDTVTGGCMTINQTITTIPANGYIMGQLFSDNDGNCVFSTGDNYIANATVTVTDGTNTYTGLTNSYGYYYILVPNGTYTATPTFSSNYTVNCTGSQSVTVAGSNVGGINFSATTPPFEDLCVYSSSWGFVPGFDAYIYTYVMNHGNLTSSGEVAVVVPTGTNYLYSTPSPSSTSGDTLFFDVNNLAPGTYFSISTMVNVPVWFQLGDLVEVCAEVELLGGGTDTNPACNENCYYDVVVGSYDPNDKAVQPMGVGNEGYIETDVQEFTYLIRFQNTGTAAAHNVYITDTLDAMLDQGSIQILASSHDMYVEFYQDDVVRFRFDNIMLPDSNSNEPESHGYVQFKINTAAVPQLTETIENTANIYFDFNEPVITNTTLNTYADFSSTTVVENAELEVYPNPTKDLLFVRNVDNANYIIYDMNGRIIQTGRVQNSTPIGVSEISAGTYFLEVDTVTGKERRLFTKE